MFQEKLPYLKNKRILIFDLETTGFPTKKPGFHNGKDQYFDYTLNSKYDTSRIVQIGWLYVEKYNFEDYEMNEIDCHLRKPIDFDSVPNPHIHGITYEMARDNGLLLSNILNNRGFAYAMLNCDYLIAHNAFFDVYVLLNELHRLKFLNLISKVNTLILENKIVCTGEISRDICELPMKGMGYKMPKLEELYFHFYKEKPIHMHDAKSDVKTIIDILRC